MKTLRQVRSRRSRFNRDVQFWREARERHQHQEGVTRKKKGISLKQAKSNYQNYWKKYNRTASIALGIFCSFCHTTPCSCDELYGKAQKANADTGYAATPSTSHLSNQAHSVERAPRLKPRGGLGRN